MIDSTCKALGRVGPRTPAGGGGGGGEVKRLLEGGPRLDPVEGAVSNFRRLFYIYCWFVVFYLATAFTGMVLQSTLIYTFGSNPAG